VSDVRSLDDRVVVPDAGGGEAPGRSKLVLFTLIMVASVANLPLAVANVALPDIGRHFDASQTQLNLVAVAYSLGLAGSVLWFGAIADRYGRKQTLLVGVLLSVPACLVAAWAPSVQVLIAARVVGGLAAGMAYPTTLSLITALWSGEGRTRSIALWSATGGGLMALGPLAAGLLLSRFWWGSVFLLTLPLVVVAVIMTVRLVPNHVKETTEPVDGLGGLISVILVVSGIAAINFAPVPDKGSLTLVLGVIAVCALVAFALRERRARNPLFDLKVAGRRIYWVAATAGMVVFGSLMGAMFVGQQYLQNVLGYSTIDAGLSLLPAALVMVLVAPHSARLIAARGSRDTLLIGYILIFVGFVIMFAFWREHTSFLPIAISYVLIGAGVGFAGTPASHSLTGSVPVRRAGMASGTADLQRDLGGAVMQSILGALLTAGYAAGSRAAIAASPQSGRVTASVESELTKSYSSAANLAKQYPADADQIIAGAKESFVHGQHWAYGAGMIAVGLGGLLVFSLFPRRDEEGRLLARYHGEDEDER
jgi:MFS transporter, DHA2 family, multidrug resistance protein